MAGFPDFLSDPKVLKKAFGSRIGMFFWRAALLAAFGTVLAFAGIELRNLFLGGTQAQTPQSPAIINSPCSFPGGSNSGSVNCGNTYNGVPSPQLQYQRTETRQAGDSYITDIFFNLISPFTPSLLSFEVHAPDIKTNLQIIPTLKGGAGMVMLGNTGMRPGFAFSSIQNPLAGQIIVRLVTSTDPAQKIKVYYSF